MIQERARTSLVDSPIADGTFSQQSGAGEHRGDAQALGLACWSCQEEAKRRHKDAYRALM